MYGNLRFLLRVLKCMNSPRFRGTAAAAAGGYLGRELECLIKIKRGAHKVQVHRVAILLHVLCGRQEQRGIVPAELHEQRAVLRVRVEVGFSIVADRGRENNIAPNHGEVSKRARARPDQVVQGQMIVYRLL